MYTLDLEKAERNQSSNCQYLLDHRESKGIPEKVYFCFIDYVKTFDCVNHNKFWKILKEIEIPDHLTCLLRNLYAGQKATVRTGHEQRTGSKLGKEYDKAVYCHPGYLTYMQSTLCTMPGWMTHKLESRLLEEISTTLDKQMIPL